MPLPQRISAGHAGLCRICIGSGCLPRHTPSPKSPSALRRYQVPWSESRSLGQSLSRPLDWFLPVMEWVHRTLGICDGRLPNRHIWRHLLLAASTARTSMGAREVTASAGSGKSCCLLRWHPITVVGTGRHHRFGSGATVAPLWHPLPLLPNPLQRLLELTLAQGSCQFPFPEDAADPPDLKTTEGKGNQTQLEATPVQVLHFAPFCSCAQIRSRDCLNWSVLGVGAIRWRFSALPNFKTLKARATAKTAQGTRIHPGWVISEFGCLVWSCWNHGGSWATWGARGDLGDL